MRLRARNVTGFLEKIIPLLLIIELTMFAVTMSWDHGIVGSLLKSLKREEYNGRNFRNGTRILNTEKALVESWNITKDRIPHLHETLRKFKIPIIPNEELKNYCVLRQEMGVGCTNDGECLSVCE